MAKVKIMKDGEEVEVEMYTPEELEQAKKDAEQAALDKAKGETGDLQKKLDDATRALQEAENDPNKKGQVERLRKERDDANKALEDYKSDTNKRLDKMEQDRVDELKTEWLDRLSGKDADLRKKIELEFDEYKPSDKSKKGIEERMTKAFTLATGTKPTPNLLDGNTSGGDRGAGGSHQAPSNNEPTENAKKIGKQLGITDKDREAADKYKQEHGGKITT